MLAQRLASLRIAVGAFRERTGIRLRRARCRPRLEAAVAPVLAELRSLRRTLQPGERLTGILLAEHFGDIVAAEPILRHLQDQDPRARIVWFCKPAFADLVRAHPGVHRVLPLTSILEAEFVVRSQLLDTAVDLHIPGKHCGRYNLSYEKRWGDPDITARTYYAGRTLLEALSLSAGLPKLDAQPNLQLPPEVRARVDALGLPARTIVLHATSNEEARNWSAKKWTALAEELSRRQPHTLVEVGLAPVFPAAVPNQISLCGRLSVAETAEVIRRAALFIGIDSGPAHVANAFQRPCVILLGRYHHFGDYMPYSGHLRRNEGRMVLHWPGACSDIPVGEVLGRVESVLST